MSQHAYSINALAEFPAYRRGRTVTGRATRTGEIVSERPMSEDVLRSIVARDIAARHECVLSEITFIDFTYTTLPTA